MSRSWLRSLLVLLLASPALGACSAVPPCPTGDLAPPARPPRFAVLLTDYASSAVALLDARGDTITESWIDSGTRASTAAAGIGGDVVLPGLVRHGELALLERFGFDVLTRIPFEGPEVGHPTQIDLRGDDPAMPRGHSPNVQDVVRIDDARVLVSRLNPTFDAETPELARGNDVIAVDLDARRIVARIDLDADVLVPAPTSEHPDATTIAFARPSSMALLDRDGMRRVVVGLARLSANYDRTGPGAIAVIDADAQQRTMLVGLDGLSGCASVAAIPGDRSRAMVLCTGDAFADEDARRATSGIVRVVLDAVGLVTIDATWRTSEHPGSPPPTSGLLALDAARAVVVADPRGEAGALDAHDALVAIDVEDDSDADLVLEAGSAFVLGEGALDPDSSVLLVPDAHARAVHRIDVAGGALTVRDALRLPTCGALPPRQVVLLE